METLLNQLGAWIQPMLQSMDSGIERALATGQALPWVVSIGLALLLGALAGEVAVRLRMVRVQGYWMAGVVCACIWWAMQSQATSSSMNSPAHAITERWSLYRWVLDLALGWLLVQAGRRLDVQWLWRNRALLTCALLVWLFTAVGVSLVLIQTGVLWRDALIAGVIVAHASPVLVQAMSQSLRAEGQVSERSLQISIIGLMLTALILPVTLMIRQNESWRSVVAITQPLLDACIAIGMGVILGAVVRWISEPPRGRAAMANARMTDASPNMIYGPALVGAVLVIVGVAHWTEVPALPGCVALGWALRGRLSAHWRARKARQARLNLPMHSGPAPLLPSSPKASPAPAAAMTPINAHDAMRWLGGVGSLALVLAFMTAGATLPWGQWIAALQSALVEQTLPADMMQALELAGWLILARLLLALLVTTLTASWSGLRVTQSTGLAVMLQSGSVTMVALWASVQMIVPQWDALVVQALAIAMLVTEVLMPFVMAIVLRALDEALDTPATIEGLRTGNSSKPTQIDTELYAMSRV